MAKIRCPKCGGLNSQERRYCKSCGINLGDYLLRTHGEKQDQNSGKHHSLLATIRRWLGSFGIRGE